MKVLLVVLMFYRKLILPALIVSLMIGLMGLTLADSIPFAWMGISYFILTLAFQYFIYEIRNPNEYYFYFNLGINKHMLWASNAFIGFMICLITIIVAKNCTLIV